MRAASGTGLLRGVRDLGDGRASSSTSRAARSAARSSGTPFDDEPAGLIGQPCGQARGQQRRQHRLEGGERRLVERDGVGETAAGAAVAQHKSVCAFTSSRVALIEAKLRVARRACRRAHRSAARAAGSSNTSRAARRPYATSAGVRRVSSASRTAIAGPPRLTMALVRQVAMISRRRRCAGDVAGEALAQQLAGSRRRASGSSSGSSGTVLASRSCSQRDLGVAQQHGQLRPRQARARRGALRSSSSAAGPRAGGRAGRAPRAPASAAA